MESKPSMLKIKTKVWIEDQQGGLVFGSGRLRILSAVLDHGSIQAAAKELNMSYRAVWGKIKATEERLGQPLITRRTGGTGGGGSELTPLGKALVTRFRQLQSQTEMAADNLFQDFLVDG